MSYIKTSRNGLILLASSIMCKMMQQMIKFIDLNVFIAKCFLHRITLPVRKLSCWSRFTRFLSLYWKSLVVVITPFALLPIIILNDIPVSKKNSNSSYRTYFLSKTISLAHAIDVYDPSSLIMIHYQKHISIDIHTRINFIAATSMHVRRTIDDYLLV